MRESLTVSGEQADFLLRSCRSVRRFKREEVSRGEVEDILETARMAASGGNRQLARYLVLQGREKVRQAGDLVLEWFEKAARNGQQAAHRMNPENVNARYRAGKDPIMRHAPGAVIAYAPKDAAWGAVDSAIALTYFSLAAHARGIGSCWLGLLVRAAREYGPLREHLGIDDAHALEGALVFGYPDITFHAIPARNPVRVRWV